MMPFALLCICIELPYTRPPTPKVFTSLRSQGNLSDRIIQSIHLSARQSTYHSVADLIPDIYTFRLGNAPTNIAPSQSDILRTAKIPTYTSRPKLHQVKINTSPAQPKRSPIPSGVFSRLYNVATRSLSLNTSIYGCPSVVPCGVKVTTLQIHSGCVSLDVSCTTPCPGTPHFCPPSLE
jgi:hypothetical protein